VAPKAHDMAREYAVLRAVHPHFPAAPRVYLLCEDVGVIGAVFFLMERRRGVVLRTEIPPHFAAIPDYARRVSEAMIDCMVDLHRVDIIKHGLGALGKPEGFLSRQVNGWAERWYRAKTHDLPEMDRVIEWLKARLPAEGAPTLIHNDFKLDNLMFDANDPGRIAAVFDWEMATVGDPLADLGLTLCYWTPPDGPVREGPVPVLNVGPEWFSREELIEVYQKKTGRDLSALGWHEVLGIFKLAVIVQQIYVRYHRGQTKDERFRSFYLRVESLVKAAAERVEAMG
jgi:aminoglycoside phosphotransferase (APT) family kinase protein